MQSLYILIPITEKRRRKDVERISFLEENKLLFYTKYSLFIQRLCIILLGTHFFPSTNSKICCKTYHKKKFDIFI